MTSGRGAGPSPVVGLGLLGCGALLLRFWHLWRYGCTASHQRMEMGPRFPGRNSIRAKKNGVEQF